MGSSQVKPSIKNSRRQAQGERPRGTKQKPQPIRRSARLAKKHQHIEAKHPLPAPLTTNPLDPKASDSSSPFDSETAGLICPSHESEANRKPKQEQKRSQEVEASLNSSGKRPRAETPITGSSHRVKTWLQKGSYPKHYFESGSKTWEDIKADTFATRLDADRMQHLGRKKSAATLSSLRRQAAEANMVPTETVEDKSLVYRSPGYERELNLSGSYLVDAPEGITDDSKLLCQTLLTNAQTVPQDTLFRDDLFSKTCTKISQRNEARIVEDISPLIAPSPETLATYGAMGLDHLIFNIDERWGESIPLTRTRPQPDRCVGFSDSTFNLLQLRKLRQCIGHFVPIEYLSPLLATWRMYFPFFACEAKSASEDIHVANKQNAHSMSMAVRGIVELFKEVKREDELHRKTLAFSISHNASQVRICGHYPIIQKGATTFHCHLIHSFDFTAQTGKDKWTAYQFTKNVYFEFMPKLQTLICSAIDQIVLKNDSRGSNLPPPILLGESLVTGTDKEPGQPNTLDMLASATASQNPPGSKRKRLTLKEQLEEQRKENEELRLIITSRNDSQIATLLRQQLQDSKEQMRQQQEQMRQQQEDSKEQMRQQQEDSKEQLRQQQEDLKEQMRQQQEQLRQQQEQLRQQQEDSKEQMRQQQEQIKQLMDTLQTKVSAG